MKNFYLSSNLEFLDAIIGATAIEYKLILITSNAKHFSFIKKLRLQPWEMIKRDIISAKME